MNNQISMKHKIIKQERKNKIKVCLFFMQGNRVRKRDGFKVLLDLKNALIINVKDPKPGLWKLRMSADGQHTIRLTGLSSLDFIHGFSRYYTLDLGSTQPRPINGKKCDFSPFYTYQVIHVRIVSSA